MNIHRTFGIVLLVAGVVLLGLGLRATDSVGESITEGLTGHFTDKTTWHIVGGAVVAVVGAGLTWRGGGADRAA